MVKKKLFLSFCLLYVMLLFPIGAAYSQDALIVQKSNGASAEKNALDNVQRIMFSGDNLSVKLFDNGTVVYALNDITKLTFGDMTIMNVINPHAVTLADVVVYSLQDEIMVKSPFNIQRLVIFDIGGKILRTLETKRTASLQMCVNVSDLFLGVYLIQIETAQGRVVKKIIKK